MKDSIALVGFMGSGKTAVGKVLAGRTDKRFVELDDVIVELAGKSIPDIFREDGEIRFREIEIEAVKRVAGMHSVVIACGGGVVLNKINIDRLNENSVIVYLKTSPQAVLRRTEGDTNRPLLNVEDPLRQVKELIKFRRPFYERAAEITVNTGRLSVEGVADKILERLREYEGKGS